MIGNPKKNAALGTDGTNFSACFERAILGNGRQIQCQELSICSAIYYYSPLKRSFYDSMTVNNYQRIESKAVLQAIANFYNCS
jgi:hypothetical protein